MHLFELVLILLACVMASAILDQIVSHMGLPLLQIGVGVVMAFLIPGLSQIEVDAELFMALFITPLLFMEAKETDRSMLWKNKASVLSMAITLVIASVLAAGFALNLIIPSIPLAAAFACAAALGPTDAAAVQALGSTVDLSSHQSTILSGEALINDASGVVSFQFAIAAAVTGAFSLKNAGITFAVLFFGGIALGILLGAASSTLMNWMRLRGYVSITSHVIYEVLSPFLIFLLAEELGVSGILAVVAAGLIMQEKTGNIVPPEYARQKMVSNSFWEVILFVINGVLFVMLGMQLPKVLNPESMGGESAGAIILAMLSITLIIMVLRFIWLILIDMIRKDDDTGKRGIKNPRSSVKDAIVTTIAGPKGAVTLSIILTIPMVTEDGQPFPQRDLIIFMTSGVILFTLLLADFLLPKLAPKETNEGEEQELANARIMVIDAVVREASELLEKYKEADFAPALRLSLARYRVRLMRLRFENQCKSGLIEELIDEVLEAQQKKADEIQSELHGTPVMDRLPYYLVLPAIRESIGYFDGAEKIGSRFEHRKGRLMMRLAGKKLKNGDYDSEAEARIYYETCAFAIELENEAVRYLKKVQRESAKLDSVSGDQAGTKNSSAETQCDQAESKMRADAAGILIQEHETALQSLWGRINYGQDIQVGDACDIDEGPGSVQLPAGLKARTGEQFAKARRFNDEADANMLNMELDQIRELRMSGRITEEQARLLREEVYLIQTSLLE